MGMYFTSLASTSCLSSLLGWKLGLQQQPSPCGSLLPGEALDVHLYSFFYHFYQLSVRHCCYSSAAMSCLTFFNTDENLELIGICTSLWKLMLPWRGLLSSLLTSTHSCYLFLLGIPACLPEYIIWAYFCLCLLKIDLGLRTPSGNYLAKHSPLLFKKSSFSCSHSLPLPLS
jgi:hypothetical protein